MAFAVARHGAQVYIDSPAGIGDLTEIARLPEPGSVIEEGFVGRPDAGIGDSDRRIRRVTRRRGTTADLAGGDEDGTPITAPSDGIVTQLNVAVGQQVEVGSVLAWPKQNKKERNSDRHRFHREPGTQGNREAVAAMASSHGPRVLPGEGPGWSAHQRIVARGRQTRLHRRQSARGVRVAAARAS